MSKSLVFVVTVLAANVLMSGSTAGSETFRPVRAVSSIEEEPPAAKPDVPLAFGQVPLHFEANRGQTDTQVDFLSRGRGHTLFLTSSEVVLSLRSANDPAALLSWRLAGADPNAEGQAVEQLPGEINYFIGNDPSAWRTNIPTYAKVRYEDIYPGIHLVYYGNQSRLEYDFIVTPGADPRKIRLTFDGLGDTKLDRTSIDDNGDLVLGVAGKEVRLQQPLLYQEIDGVRQPIAGGYTRIQDETTGLSQIGFQVAAYDAARPLIIDPILEYSTYFGGAGSDSGRGVAMDGAGNVYLTGSTSNAAVFPGPGGFATNLTLPAGGMGGQVDSFVMKLDKNGVLKYSGYFGGSANDTATSIAVSSSGKVSITGYTNSTDFPMSPNPPSASLNKGAPGGSLDAFVVTVDANGQLVYGTYLGGLFDDLGMAVSMNSDPLNPQLDDLVYVTGTTYSTDLTAKNAFQTSLTGSPGGGSPRDAFVAQLDISKVSANDQVVYLTYMGGSSSDDGFGIVRVSGGSVFVTGQTCSTDVADKATPKPPANAYQNTAKGGCDAFVAQVSYDGKTLEYFTYLGGASWDLARGIYSVSSNQVVITGETVSASDFPKTNDAVQATHGGGTYDVFVTSLSTNTGLVYSTFLGGSGDDYGYAVGGDISGAFYVTGQTCLPYNPQPGDKPFPPVSALAPNVATHQNDGTACDAFVSKLGPPPLGLDYSTYLGGAEADVGLGLVVDSMGRAYVTGRTTSSNFPTAAAIQPNTGGSGDAFLAKVAVAQPTGGKGPFAYTGDGSIIDTENDSLLSDKVPGGLVIGLNTDGAPGAVAVSPDGSKAYGLAKGDFGANVPPSLLVYDIDAKKLTPFPVGLPGGLGPQGVAVSPDAARLYVAIHEDANVDPANSSQLYVMDAATNLVTDASAREAGQNFDGVAVTPDGSRVYIAAYETHKIRRYNPQTKAYDIDLNLGTHHTRHVAMAPDGQALYVAAQNDDVVSVVDTSNNPNYTDIPVAGDPRGLAVTPDGKSLYVAGASGPQSGVAVIDIVTKAVTPIVGAYGNDVAVTPDGKKVYVAGDSYVTVIDTATKKVTKIILGAAGNSVAIGPQDRDADGIIDQVDANTNSFSNDFTGQNFSDTSSGTIKDRANLQVKVWRQYPKGFYARASGASGQAWINACNTDIYLPATSEVKVSCGSLTLEAIRGPVSVGLGSGRFLSVTTGGSVKVTETLPGQFRVDNMGTTTVTIVDSTGQLLGSISPGQSLTTTSSSDPILTITNQNNQTVTVGWITVTGTATDAGRGDNGISSVMVNGVRASGDTATGSGTANWTRTVTLIQGANTITVVARDGSASQNATTQTITVTYNPPANTAISPTTNAYHVFPQYADGRLSDGRYFRSSLLISNPSSATGVNCTFQLYGLTIDGLSTFTYNLAASGWVISPSSAVQSLKSGYATLQCSANVEAQLLYSFYTQAGAKISEATVFSSPPAPAVQILGDGRESARIGIAIANDSDQSATYTLAAYSNTGSLAGMTSITLNPRTNRAAYLDEFFQVPANTFGPILVSSSTGTASLIGLRFTGDVFTTIPATNRSALASTAATYHVFPQVADGVLGDGTYFRSTLMITNPSSSSGADCTFRLYGLSINTQSTYTYALAATGWSITPLASNQSLRSGYATLQCSAKVEAQLLYSFYSQNGGKISEATVFSSPPAGSTQVIADGRESARLGLAVANDTDQKRDYTITVYDNLGMPVGTPYIMPLDPRTNRAAFINDLITLPQDHYGQVVVTGTGGSGSIIGLRFTGGVFTTIPEVIR